MHTSDREEHRHSETTSLEGRSHWPRSHSQCLRTGLEIILGPTAPLFYHTLCSFSTCYPGPTLVLPLASSLTSERHQPHRDYVSPSTPWNEHNHS